MNCCHCEKRSDATIHGQRSSKTKLEAAIAIIISKSSVSELSQKYGIHPGVLQRWKIELLEGGNAQRMANR